ncbi:alpha/beta hydrolase [Leucobacter triazinivorans]|uniref:DUF1023 domain-containing protein n=1 Tax=Leucobacter triazinivorans TaxID=1784719 RepID=A0A4P6KEK1_9MICO|nr:alpha/beta hydrolase [Leucobacter triazinivorans]QBE48550.1 hypothetical protein EVS81_06645 [Leucobacter triazinivorans]
MTIYVPGNGSALLEGTPVFGSVEEINAAGEFVQDVATDAMRYTVDVRNAQMALGSSSSAGVTKIRAKLDERLLPGAAAVYRSAGNAKRAFDSYASEVDRVHADAGKVVRDVNDALATIRTQAAQIEEIASLIRVPAPYAWNVGAPGALPQPQLGYRARDLDADERALAVEHLRGVHEWQWTLAASLWRHAIEDIDSAKARWANLIEDRRDAEGRLVKALGDTTIGQLIGVSGDDLASRRFTIATGISGELWGAGDEAPEIAKSHPLLKKLLGSESGEHVWNAPPDPAEVAARWERASAGERQRLIDEAPWVIGNLPGLPFSVRDEANRKMVEFYQQHPQLLTPEQLKLMAGIRNIIKLEESQRVPNPPIQIVALDMSGEVPKAAVSYGNLDAATHTTWQVPGMNSDAHLALEGWDEASRNLYDAQNDVEGFSGSNAVVAWLGYDTPDHPLSGDFGVLDSKSAGAGATRFAAELDGAHAARGAGRNGLPAVSVLAHSYGTTVATIALTQLEHAVDSLTMLGSAGLDTEQVPDYGVLNVKETAAGQKAIYTTHASADQLAPFGAGASGRGQPNPDAVAPFGVHRFSAVYAGGLSFSSEGDPVQNLKRTDGHSTIGSGENPGMAGMSASEGHGYLDPQTQSLASVAQITTDRISDGLAQSFARSEAECTDLIMGRGGTFAPIRTRCEDG